ncbi:hypothetical protein SAMN02745218_01748 [Desulfofundulus australicus DSM 11792]|uniref:UPF0235 protein SAMN02745218_01748 n=1 Tax=Desulfofundulus australicus DSM 11792 TaxID=1121425 RepID=A0A1M5A0D7_9FIRM|nr:DUF167 domain-containing protein [Desulfofundulus australicus]SHF23763.1 hypothetical protein SAMN02745218_01748 [Desulfofundulus australicus DSM 11792]
MVFLREEKEAVVFKVRVQPRAARNELAGLHEDALKIRLTAPPVEGEANEALRVFLARLLGVPRSQVEIAAGQKGRSKLIRVKGIAAGRILSLLETTTGARNNG